MPSRQGSVFTVKAFATSNGSIQIEQYCNSTDRSWGMGRMGEWAETASWEVSSDPS